MEELNHWVGLDYVYTTLWVSTFVMLRKKAKMIPAVSVTAGTLQILHA